MSTVIYSLLAPSSGFSQYVLRTYKPRSDKARALVDRLKADPRFPRHIQTRDFLEFYLRHSGARWYERRASAAVWASYAQWRGKQLSPEKRGHPAETATAVRA